MAAPHPAMQQGAYYMNPQAAAMAQQPPGIFSPKMPMQFASAHQLHEQQQQHLAQQHQQAMQGQINIRPGGSMHSEAALGGGGSGGVMAGQNKQDASEMGPSGDVPGSSGGGDGDPSYLKGAERKEND